jgi:lysozyme
MKIRLVILVMAVLLAGVGLYFSGRWVPNYPSPKRYPTRGIDVSRHQGSINWELVSARGIQFVYLKATEGGDFQDPSFSQNLQSAHEAGLACGAYHFFRFSTPGLVQAQNFIKTAPSDKLALPPAIDLEYWGNSSERPPPETFQTELRAYVGAITAAYGCEPVFYTSDDFSQRYLVSFAMRRLWVRNVLFEADRTKPWLFWQFSERGRVPGIDGLVDMDVFNGSWQGLLALKKSP